MSIPPSLPQFRQPSFEGRAMVYGGPSGRGRLAGGNQITFRLSSIGNVTPSHFELSELAECVLVRGQRTQSGEHKNLVSHRSEPVR